MAGIRRRNVTGSVDQVEETVSSALSSLKKFDVYNKVHDDYVQKSKSGGAVTLITSIIITMLLYSEICEFMSVEVVDSITVDTSINRKLPIGINITFPHLRCDEISVDTVDSSGENQVDVHGTLEKINLDSNGQITAGDPVAAETDCWSCLEASDEEHKCCNSCADLKAAYSDKDLPYFHILDTAMQCKASMGCRVHGNVLVNKVSGNVHVALGHSAERDGKHVHEFNMNEVSDGFNTSHHIHSVAFGDSVPGVLSPLDGTFKIVKHGAYMFHYYIKLVPTVFTDRYGMQVYTNQYSVTDSAKNVMVRKNELSGLPGVFLVYDFSPFLMEKTEKTKPWSYIFTSMCAIIGGVFSIATLVEMLVSGLICRTVGCNPAAGSRVI
jgi:endoplasmic reticulum-Golgi intermediate compartment protein 3